MPLFESLDARHLQHVSRISLEYATTFTKIFDVELSTRTLVEVRGGPTEHGGRQTKLASSFLMIAAWRLVGGLIFHDGGHKGGLVSTRRWAGAKHKAPK